MTAPPPTEEIAERLRAWAGDGAVVEDVQPVLGGFDTHIFRFRLDGRRRILRLYPTATRGPSAEREAAVLTFLGSVGYPAPRLVAAAGDIDDFGLPYVVMEEAPGVTALDRIQARLRGALVVLDALAEAQARIHSLPTEGWPFPDGDDEPNEIDRRLAGADGVAEPGDPGLVEALAWLRAHAGEVRGEERAVCHNDFHPRNVLVADDGSLSVIDWENASLGDRHSDLARTLVIFEWAPVVATTRIERTVLRLARRPIVGRYRAAYERHLPVDERRLRYWMAFHAAEGWWEATSLLDGTFDRDTRTDERVGPAAVLAPAMAKLFERTVAAAS